MQFPAEAVAACRSGVRACLGANSWRRRALLSHVQDVVRKLLENVSSSIGAC